MTNTTCSCGRGKASAFDAKCGHCRTRAEQKAVDKLRLDYYARAARERSPERQAQR